MPTELEEVSLRIPTRKTHADSVQLVEFLHHGNTQIRQIGKASIPISK
jgi:hypothetical protein